MNFDSHGEPQLPPTKRTMAATFTAASLAEMNYRELQACCKANGEKASGKVRAAAAHVFLPLRSAWLTDASQPRCSHTADGGPPGAARGEAGERLTARRVHQQLADGGGRRLAEAQGLQQDRRDAAGLCRRRGSAGEPGRQRP